MKLTFTKALLLAGSCLLSLPGFGQAHPSSLKAPYRGQPASGSALAGRLPALNFQRATPPTPLRREATQLARTATDPVTQEWVARYNQPAPPRSASYELARDIAVDGAGNVYVTGLSAGSNSSTAQMLTVKYSPSGQQLWEARYAGLGSASEYGMAVGVDAAGNAYVAANESGAVGNVLVKYAPNGTQLWAVRYAGPNGTGARLYSLRVDAAGNAYLTGDAPSSRPGGDYDYLTVKYAPTGQLLWDARYNSPDNEGDYAQALGLDATGNVYVTGISYRSGMASSGEFATVKYSSTGQQLWVALYNSPGRTYDEGRLIAVDPAGNAYVSGYSFSEDDGAASGSVTVKYSPSGQQLWDARSGGYPRATALDAAGNVFVTRSDVPALGVPDDFLTTKYSPEGQLVWNARYNGPSNGLDVPRDLGVDAEGNVYVTGTSAGGSATIEDYATVKYSSAGQQLWVARYNGPAGNGYDNAEALALDPAGNVYVTGYSQGPDFSSGIDFATVKYSQSPTTEMPDCNRNLNQPAANADRLVMGTGPLTFTAAQLLANDTDPRGRALRVASVGKPSTGTLVTNPDGTYTYTPQPGVTGPVTFSYLIEGVGPVRASQATYHYYEFVSAPGICWADAKAAAAARTYEGMPGYLATVTFAGEKDFLAGKAQGQYWLGASDASVEGEWRWQTGPEAGQLIWRGGPQGIGAAYSHWLPGQPDDFKNPWRPQGEDYALMYGNSGLWNDADNCNSAATTAGYVVEYGGLEACTPILYAIGTVTLQVGTSARVAAVAPPPAAGQAQLQASPNPSTGQFRVQVLAGLDGPAQLDLFDLQGRRVRALFTGALHAGEQREVAVDAQELSAGLYVLRLQSGAQVQHLRLLLQK